MTGFKIRAAALLILAQTALQIMVMGGLPWVSRHLLGLPPSLVTVLERSVLVLCLGSLGCAGLLLLVALRPASPTETRTRALGLPVRLAVLAGVTQLIGLGYVLVALGQHDCPVSTLLGVLLLCGSLLSVTPVGIYSFGRLLLTPLLLHIGDETLPAGLGAPMGLQIGYGLGAVALAALIPAAVLGAALLDQSSLATAEARAHATATRLVAASADLAIGPALELASRTQLGTGALAVVKLASGTLVPEESAVAIGQMPYVEAPLEGALAGAAVRVYFRPHSIGSATPFWTALALLCIALACAVTAGLTVGRELGQVAASMDRVASGRDSNHAGSRPGSISTTEVRRITRAANRILERVPRFTMESFLAIERSEEASRLKSQFLANMSHDLRSPLNSILGFSELLLRGIEGPITDGQKKRLEVIQESGHHLLRQLNAILDTAKMESGRMELHRQTVPPAELLRSALSEARRGRPAALADSVSIELMPGIATMHIDPLRVTQAVTHLINHAFDVSQGKAFTLRASQIADPDLPQAGRDGRLFVLEIDLPVELASDQADRLFDGFSRTEGPKQTRSAAPPSIGRGLNLMLPLAKRLLELHGGTLGVVGSAPVSATATATALAAARRTRKVRLRATLPTSARLAPAKPTK